MGKAGWEETLGFTVIGAGLGFIFGGPIGACIGSRIGDAVGQMAAKIETPPPTAAQLEEGRRLQEKYKDNPEYFNSGHG